MDVVIKYRYWEKQTKHEHFTWYNKFGSKIKQNQLVNVIYLVCKKCYYFLKCGVIGLLLSSFTVLGNSIDDNFLNNLLDSDCEFHGQLAYCVICYGLIFQFVSRYQCEISM